MAFDVFAADILAADAIDEGDAALPAVTLLRGAREHLAVEVEVGLVEVMAEHAGPTGQRMHACPELQVLKISGIPELIESSQEAGLMHDRVLQGGRHIHMQAASGGCRSVGLLPLLCPCVNVEMLQGGGQRGVIGGIVGLLGIARSHVVPMLRRDAGFGA